MKIIVILAVLFCIGCASPPVNPLWQMSRDVFSGRSNLTADQINQACADYDKARAEYEQSASYKATLVAVSPLLILGAAANGMTPSCGYRAGCMPSRATINSFPTGGGGWRTSVRWK